MYRRTRASCSYLSLSAKLPVHWRVCGMITPIRERALLMIAAGYEDGNDASSLRSDPAFKLAQGTLPSGPDLASQPTISRLENLPDRRSLLSMGQALVDLYCGSFRRAPKSHRAGYRRYVRCCTWRSAIAPVQCPS